MGELMGGKGARRTWQMICRQRPRTNEAVVCRTTPNVLSQAIKDSVAQTVVGLPVAVRAVNQA